MADPDVTPEDDQATDGLVRPLPDALASKIAAGEVVQRPANALKELIENALDAGASRVDVTLKRAGSELIQVSDDGCGMGPVDAAAAFGRHATSKLRLFEDLERLRTLGFRGEALASIASVAQVELKTKRRQDEAATCVRVDGGELKAQGPCAAPDGTCVSVRNLFYNVPARRAFLKTPATEFKHLVETFQSLALSHPSVGFSLVHDDTEVWRLAPAAGGEDAALVRRLSDLSGGLDADELVRVEETTSYLSIRGVAAAPDRARRSRGDQYLFVNGRYVKSRSLDHAVAQAYGALLPEGRHPLFALFLDVDPRHVDVNVHPTKTEVKFDDDRGVYSFVKAVTKRALAEDGLGLTFDAEAAPVEPPPPGPDLPDPDLDAPLGDGSAGPPSLPAFASARPVPSRAVSIPSSATRTPSDVGPRPPALPPVVPGSVTGPIPSGLGPVPEEPDAAETLDLEEPEARTLWQLHGRYLLSPVRSGLLVVDQRRAHERILYERARTTMEGGMASSQQLLFPFTVALPAADRELLDEILPELRALGFEMDVPKTGAVVVRGVPTDVTLGHERDVLDDLIAHFRRNRQRLHLDARENLARSMAARSAIRPGHTLGPDEARSLVDQLFACADPFSDPAGRPTMTRLSSDELDRRFQR